MMKIKDRKLDHIEICKNYDVEKSDTLLKNVQLIHQAAPEIDKSEIKTKINFLGKELRFPFIIPAITGGHPDLVEINKTLSKVAEELEIGIGVGSQRAAIENKELRDSLTIVKETAPNTLKIANLGAPQLAKDYRAKEAKEAIKMIDADALAIHFNYLQEAIQLEGDTEARGVLEKIKNLNQQLETPIIVKETGAGVSREIAKKLDEIGVEAIDVSGKGGTSWSWVEKIRANNENQQIKKELGQKFANWGIPTAASILESNIGPKIMATGGIRSGKEAAKALTLGADVTGSALPLIEPAEKGEESLKNKLNQFKKELELTMFLTSSKNIEQLKNTQKIIKGELRNWIEQRNLKI